MVSQSARGTVIQVSVEGLVRGEAYTVRGGSSPLTGTSAPASTPSASASTTAADRGGRRLRDDVARRRRALGAVRLPRAALGVVGIRLLVLPRTVDPRVERRVHLLGTLGAVAAVNAGIVGFVIRSANALQVSGVDLLYADLSPFAESTRFGNAFLATTLGFGACLTILAVAWVLDRPGLRWPAFLLALALVWSYPLSGHQATEPNASVVGQVADWVHLVTAMLWVGGVLTLAVVVWPLAPDLRRTAFLRFSRIAIGLVAALVVAGTVVAIERLPAVSDLWETSYGQILLAKVALVLVALAWGGIHHTFVRPRLKRGERTPGVGRSLLGDSAVAMAVLLVAAVLVNGAPPPVESDACEAAPTERRRAHHLAFRPAPSGAGDLRAARASSACTSPDA